MGEYDDIEVIQDLSTEEEVPTGMEFDLAELMGEPIEGEEANPDFFENLAERLDENTLGQISSDLIELIEEDENSRKEWLKIYADGLNLLGFKMEERTEPWAGACGVYHPLMSEALVKFQAETIMETFPASGPVKTRIIGKETQAKKDAAVNVAADMNFQLTEVMLEYRPEHEKLLWGLGLSGNAFKKIYHDPNLNRPMAPFVPAEDLIVGYGVSNLESAERVTHLMRKTENDVKKLQDAGFYSDVDLGDPETNSTNIDDVEKKIAESMGFSATSDSRYKLYESHVLLDLEEYDFADKETDKNGIAVPYIVTIDKQSTKVLSIYRNWTPEDPKKLKREHFVHYSYIPGFGFYAFGLIHLLGSFAKSGTSIIRQLVDAGTLSNLPGGFKTKGLRIKGDDTPISPGEFRDVDVASGTIKDNIMTLPYKEPSQVLMALLQTIVEEGRKFASTTDLQVSDMSAQSPVGTTLAILERTLKIMSSIQSRVHFAMKREFKLLAAIIRDFAPEEYPYDPEEGDRKAKQTDYDMVEVIPVSDPNSSTMAQKVTQYQAVLQLAEGSPQIYDMPELHRQMLEVLQIRNIDKIIPSIEDQKPKDPVSENMAILNGKPVRAFLGQDHKSHIAVHMSLSQDPLTAELLQSNPQAATIAAAGYAHVVEHMAFQYRSQIEEQMGITLPAPDEELPQEVEVELSKLLAQAAAQLVQKNQSEAQKAQQEEEAADPLNVIQREELRIKEKKIDADTELSKGKLMTDSAKFDAEYKFKEKKLEADMAINIAKIETSGNSKEADLEFSREKEQASNFLKGIQMGNASTHSQNTLEQQKESARKNNKSAKKD